MKQYWIHIIFLSVLASACRPAGEPVPLVKVGDHTLYRHQLAEAMPEKMGQADSLLWADDYIANWTRNELFILKAEDNLTAEQKDVRKELEEYRNSLITFRYKDALVNQKMDTVVSQQEVMNYYNSHKDEFFLTQDILKAIYMKIPVEIANPKMLKSLCADESPDKLSELNDYCLSYAKQYDKFDDKWLPASQVLGYIPVKIDDLQYFLRWSKFVESKDDEYFYMIYIRNFRFVGQPAPIDYVESQVKNLILNARKNQFLKQIEDEVYKEGIDNRKVKFF